MKITGASQAASESVSFKNILYATDLSRDSVQALPYALSISRKYGSLIVATHVISSFTSQAPLQTIALHALTAQAVREAREGMAKLETQLANVPHEIVIREGDVWEELSAIVAKNKIDLVVTGTHGRTGVGKFLMGSVAERIFRHAPCPVLTVGPNVSGEAESIVDMHEILFSTDFSPESLKALPYAISLAQQNQSRLYLLHVASMPMDHSEAGSKKNRLLALLSPETKLFCEPKAYVEFGDPAQEIINLAEELAVDLIVVGTKHVPAITGAVTHLGMATAYKVASQAICPILTIRG